MGWFDAIISRGMEVSAREFSCVDSYVACGRSTEYYTPFQCFRWKGVVEFYKRDEKYIMR